MSDPLADGEARVHVVRVGGERAEDRALLAPEELERVDRFLFARDRELFVAAHAALRRALGAALDVPPRELRFEREEGGRPRLADGELAFSLSHSGRRALVALARTPEVGVDVEARRRGGLDLERVAARSFSPAERAALAVLTSAEREEAFHRIWTRKEAYVKALGRGLYHPLDAFDVSCSADARFLAFRDGSRIDEWGLLDLDAGEGYAAALALRPAPRRVDLRQGA
jgi:4'-phosphopantetheinyl transferase